MTHIRGARILLSSSTFVALGLALALGLGLALLCGCQSASTGASSPRDPARSGAASTSEREAIDRAYLRTLYQINAEENQAMEDARLPC